LQNQYWLATFNIYQVEKLKMEKPMSKVDESKTIRDEIDKLEGVDKVKKIISLSEKGSLLPEFQIELLYEAADISEKSGYSEGKMQTYYKLSQLISSVEHDIPKSNEFLQKALSKSRHLQNVDFESNILNQLGVNASNSGDFSMALQYFNEALTLAEKTDDLNQIAHMHNHIAIGYWRISELEKAMDHCFKALRICEEINDLFLSGNINLNLGNIFGSMRDLKNSMEHYEKSLEIYLQLDMKEKIALTYNGISMIHNLKGEFDQSLEITRKSLEIGKSINDGQLICLCTNNIGSNYRQMGDIDKALKYFIEAIQLAEENKFGHMVASFSLNVAQIYMMQEDPDNAVKYLDLALKYSEEMNHEELLMNNHHLRSQILKHTNDFENSLDYFERYTELKEKLSNEQKTKHLNELTKKFELDKKEREAEIYRLKNVELVEANQKLSEAQGEIAHLAHISGKAEVAANVIHNIGNVMNSAVTSTVLIQEALAGSKVNTLRQVTDLISNQDSGFKHFVNEDPRGEKIPDFLSQITEEIEGEVKQNIIKADTISNSLEHIKAIIDFHQLHSISTGTIEKVELNELVVRVMNFMKPSFNNQGVEIGCNLPGKNVIVKTEKPKLEQILINLLQNALESFNDFATQKKEVKIKLTIEKESIELSVMDTGKGIESEKLDSIFKYGYTSKTKGHGLGLHSCANSAGEIGARIFVDSEGEGYGATFKLLLPID